VYFHAVDFLASRQKDIPSVVRIAACDRRYIHILTC
jgi:hypothetical protein